MRIGIEAHQATRLTKTGTEWYTYRLIEALAALHTPDEFLLYAHIPFDQHLSTLAPNVRPKILGWPPHKGWTQTRFALEMLMHPPDALFVPSHVPPFLHPRATVVTVHDVGFLRSPEVYSRTERIYQRAMHKVMLSAQQLIVPTQFTKSELMHFFPRLAEQRIHVIHHGFQADRFVHNPEAQAQHRLREKYHITGPLLLYIGRVEAKKNIGRVLAAFQNVAHNPAFAGAQLFLAGKIAPDFTDIEKRIDQHGLRGRVIAPGYVPDDELPTLLHIASVFVFVSLYEGFGFPVLEAQASGVPVLTSNAVCIPEVAGGGAHFVDPQDTQAITAGMELLLTDNAIRAHLIAQGKENITRFSWEVCARQTLDVLYAATA